MELDDTDGEVTDAQLRIVTAHLAETERILDRYTATKGRITALGIDDSDTGIDQLRAELDSHVLHVVTEWELIGRPQQLQTRIHALPGAHQASIDAHIDPDTNKAFDQITDSETPDQPTPLDDNRTPPPFPIESLPDWTQEHAQAVAEQIQVPVDLTAMLVIGSLAAAATGRANVIVSENWSEPVNLYLVTAMRSGSGKSAAEKLCCHWLRQWQQERIDAVIDDWSVAKRIARVAEKKAKEVERAMSVGTKDRHDLAHALEELREAERAIPELPRLLVDDATPEAIATLLAVHGERLAIMSTEADLFDMVLRGKQGQRANMNVYLKAWSGDTLIRDRKGSSESGPEMTSLNNPLLTVACTVQPSVLTRLNADEEMASRGFSARFMMAMPEDRIGRRDQSRRFSAGRIPTTDIYNITARALADQWSRSDTAAAVTMSEAGAKLLLDYLEEIEPTLANGEPNEHLAEWSSKLWGSIARYAGLLHLAEGYTPLNHINEATVQRAIDLGRYWFDTASIVLAMGDQALEQAKTILRWMQEQGRSTYSMRDIQTGVRRPGIGLDRVADYLPALTLLVDNRWLLPDSTEWADNVGPNSKKAPNFEMWRTVTKNSRSAFTARTARGA
jgi:replicative DNA helicase